MHVRVWLLLAHMARTEGGVMELNPIGARIWVEDIIPVDEMQEFSKRTGIALVQYEDKAPRPTTGWVFKVGNDPMIQEMCQPGDVVFWERYAGTGIVIEGKQYRVLGIHEITTVARGTREEKEKLTGVSMPPYLVSSSSSSSSS